MKISLFFLPCKVDRPLTILWRDVLRSIWYKQRGRFPFSRRRDSRLSLRQIVFLYRFSRSFERCHFWVWNTVKALDRPLCKAAWMSQPIVECLDGSRIVSYDYGFCLASALCFSSSRFAEQKRFLVWLISSGQSLQAIVRVESALSQIIVCTHSQRLKNELHTLENSCMKAISL